MQTRVWILAIGLLLLAGRAEAICNVIPGVTQQFRGALGSLNRPYAIPGDEGQQLTIKLDLAGCDDESPGAVDLPGGVLPEDDYFVTVLFTPPGGAPRNAVVLTTTSNEATCQARIAEVGGMLFGGQATCRTVTPGTMKYAIPDAATVSFRFPDTDAELAPDEDDRTFTGPATLAVTPVTMPLPFGLASNRCAETPGLVACIDELYRADGTCGTHARNLSPIFGSFTALPPANDYEALCTTPDTECDGTASELRFTVDTAGNVLVPMDWRGVLLRPDGIPVPRLVRGDIGLPAFAGIPAPVDLPGRSFVASYAPGGQRVPPIFEPLADPTSPNDMTLFGSVDASVGVVRIARRQPDLTAVIPEFRQCSGGSDDGLPCVVDDECPAGICGATTCHQGGIATGSVCRDDLDCPGANAECGPALFELRDRLLGGVGPGLVDREQYALSADNPAPIEGLVESDDLFAFVELEAIAGEDEERPQPQDLNGDGDTSDPVLIVRNRSTGEPQLIGDAGSIGRAVTRVRDPPFRFSSLFAEGDLVAYLEPEPFQGNCALASLCDQNGDGDTLDSILRVFRVDPQCDGQSCAQEITEGLAIAVDAEPLVNGRSLVTSRGLVFFRVSEALSARRELSTLEGALTFTGRALSDDGRFIVFERNGVVIGTRDVLLHDRLNGQTSMIATGSRASISGDGRFVAFNSTSPDLVGDDTNASPDYFLYDRIQQTIERVSVSSQGEQAQYPVEPLGRGGVRRLGPMVSRDGRFIIFFSDAVNLSSSPSNNWYDVFLRDRHLGETTRLTPISPFCDFDRQVDCFERHPTGQTASPAISADGSTVAYAFSAQGSMGSSFDLFIENDSDVGADRFPLDSLGTPTPSLSAHGRFTAFSSPAPTVVNGDTNNAHDVFVYDRIADRAEIIGTRNGECLSGGRTYGLSIDSRGRFLAFDSTSGCVTPAARTGINDVFIHDRVTGHTTLISLPQSLGALIPSISGDGRFASFVFGETPGQPVTAIWGPDPSDLASDFSSDGALDDTVLQVLDARALVPELLTLGPAEEVVVYDETAAFLMPERANQSDRNLDGDLDDRYVHLWASGVQPIDLQKEAIGLELSSALLAALAVDASGEVFAEVFDRLAVTPAWTRLGPPARSIAVEDQHIAVIGSDEGSLHVASRSGDNQFDLVATGQMAEDMVLGDRILAMRTPEAAQGADLNGDGDLDDDVLQVFDFETGQVLNSGQAVTPCRLEACDPRVPYRVTGDTVTFLTLEADQGGQDLDGDGNDRGLVLQVFNAREAVTAASLAASSSGGPLGVPGSMTLAGASSGLCAGSGTACALDSDCADGRCFLPPGACIEDLGTSCECGGPEGCTGCGPEEFCVPVSAQGIGTCQIDRGRCTTDADCQAPAVCEDAAEDLAQLAAPLSSSRGRGHVFVTGAIRTTRAGVTCIENTQCEPGYICSGAGTCEPERRGLVNAGAPDTDADGVADPFDNCAEIANTDQRDANGNGAGDACDLLVLGLPVDLDGPTVLNRASPLIPLAVLGSFRLDVAEIDGTTLAVGPGAAAPAHRNGPHLKDVDGDGLLDLLGHYRSAEIDLGEDATEICLSGETLDGIPFAGCQAIRTITPRGCGLGFELPLAVGALVALRRRRRLH